MKGKYVWNSVGTLVSNDAKKSCHDKMQRFNDNFELADSSPIVTDW